MDIARGRHAHHSFLFPPVSYHVDWSITFSHRRRVPRGQTIQPVKVTSEGHEFWCGDQGSLPDGDVT